MGVCPPTCSGTLESLREGPSGAVVREVLPASLPLLSGSAGSVRMGKATLVSLSLTARPLSLMSYVHQHCLPQTLTAHQLRGFHGHSLWAQEGEGTTRPHP